MTKMQEFPYKIGRIGTQGHSMTKNEASDLIYDVGAHKGEDSDFYLKLGYRVVAIEANPVLCEYLKQRFSKEIKDGTFTLIEKAIGDSEAGASFYVNKKNSAWGTADPARARSNQRKGAASDKITVQSIRFCDVIDQYGCPFYLKIDVEGADMLCLKALEDVKCYPKYISIESTKTSWLDLLTEFDTFERLRYTKFKVIDQKTHKNRKFRDRHGELVSYAFEFGATGPFGQDLDGIWLSKKQAIRKYIPIFLLYKTVGDNTLMRKPYKILSDAPLVRRVLRKVSWYDTHAMRDDTP
jgi:FkbM family methyltransferase